MPGFVWLFRGLLVLAAPLSLAAKIEITDADYEGRAQFKIVTTGATWFYDKAGGGFSRLIDREGRDWISFHKEPLSENPASAGAGYRGMPNAIFGKENPDAGAGHPGFDLCTSERFGTDAIRTVSKSGTWAWTWRFTDTHALFTMEKADPALAWWFLYEGAIAGRFAPQEQYWGNNLGGPRRETPDLKKRGEPIGGEWRWVYFGDRSASRVLFAAEIAGETAHDYFCYMGATAAGVESANGMVVFGFGRAGAQAYVKGAGLTIAVGFIEDAVPDEAARRRVARQIESLVRKIP